MDKHSKMTWICSKYSDIKYIQLFEKYIIGVPNLPQGGFSEGISDIVIT